MPTMSHTKQQRVDWHRGKKRVHETATAALQRIFRSGNWRGAWTPVRLKRGIWYQPLKEARR